MKPRQAAVLSTAKNERILALDCLHALLYEGAYSNLVFNERVRRSNLPPETVSAAAALFYGSLVESAALDEEIADKLRIPISKLDSLIHCLLRLASYEILFMEKPAYASVSEAVKLTRKLGLSSAASLVNAVLRKIASHPLDCAGRSRLANLATNAEVFGRLRTALGEEAAEAYLLTSKQARPQAYRFRGGARQLELLLEEAEGALAPGRISPLSVIEVRERQRWPRALRARIDRDLIRQGESASLPAIVLGPQPGERIADFCAAPGNKSLEIQDLRNHEGQLAAYDLYPQRLMLIEARFRRAGLSDEAMAFLHLKSRDMRTADTLRFQRILVDAPCSALGLLATKPELRYRSEPDALASLLEIQAQLLDSAAQSLEVGGVLVYSTCSIDRAENQDQIEAFLTRHPEFVRDCFFDPRIGHGDEQISELLIDPSTGEAEGFYMAKLKKNEESRFD
ncbi:MAG: transcription antitermination factor NusB [Eubacteriales bacterium]|nr:transcription antitermination factor NusB [Eubacteriales bacterium]